MADKNPSRYRAGQKKKGGIGKVEMHLLVCLYDDDNEMSTRELANAVGDPGVSNVTRALWGLHRKGLVVTAKGLRGDGRERTWRIFYKGRK